MEPGEGDDMSELTNDQKIEIMEKAVRLALAGACIPIDEQRGNLLDTYEQLCSAINHALSLS
jgi:hypothetical protein